uniref:Uncharacterized protein n=1 Tax=Anguilla anguilla TaxID=7936 RepID=A0A0E9Q1S5_ANGAN
MQINTCALAYMPSLLVDGVNSSG